MTFNPAPFVKDMEKHMRHAIVRATADLLGRVAHDYGLPLEEMLKRYDLPHETDVPMAPVAKKPSKKAAAMRTPCCAINAKKQPCKRFAIDGSSLCTLHRRIGAAPSPVEPLAGPVEPLAGPVEPAVEKVAPMEIEDDVMMHLDEAFEDSQKTVTDVPREEEVDEDELLNMLMTELQISA